MPHSRLTPRQLTMIRLVMEGRSYVVIAAELGVTRDTVAHQLVAARRACGAENNAQLIAQLMSAGVLLPPELPESGPEELGSDGGLIGGLALVAAMGDRAELWAAVPAAIALGLL